LLIRNADIQLSKSNAAGSDYPTSSWDTQQEFFDRMTCAVPGLTAGLLLADARKLFQGKPLTRMREISIIAANSKT
jgi:hypothetical protein